MQMTNDEMLTALAGVLTHLGKLIETANGDDKIIGAVTVTFQQSGQFNLGFVGSLDKALTMGALTDAMLSFRDIVNAKEVGNQMLASFQEAERIGAYVESLTIPDKNKN